MAFPSMWSLSLFRYREFLYQLAIIGHGKVSMIVQAHINVNADGACGLKYATTGKGIIIRMPMADNAKSE
jgi:hypothetical protein